MHKAARAPHDEARGDGDTVEHAQLTWGDGVVVPGSIRRGSDREFDRLVTTTAEAGRPTAIPYVVDDDVAAASDWTGPGSGEVDPGCILVRC